MDIFENMTVILSSDTVIVGGQPTPGAQSNQSGAESSGVTGTAVGSPAPVPPAETQPAGLPLWQYIIVYGAMLAALYFFMFRPQRKRTKEMKEMQTSLKIGENVVTTAGMFGKIVGVGQDSFLVEFGENRGVRIWIRKSDISGIKSPVTTPPPAVPTE